MTNRQCKFCSKTKQLNEFVSDVSKRCKLCMKEYKHNWHMKNRDRILAEGAIFRENNRDKLRVMYKNRNPEEKKASSRACYLKHKERRLKEMLDYRNNNKEKVAKRHSDYIKNNPDARLRLNLRTRINQALKSSAKAGSAVKDLGCTIEEFKIYLENKFRDGMTWENKGKKGWHIDHIIPLSSFDLKNRKEFLKACHYTNMQPLWWHENLSKSDRIIEVKDESTK